MGAGECFVQPLPSGFNSVDGRVCGRSGYVGARQAGGMFSLLFSAGLFASIALVGVICSLLGRMLGDISPLWGVPIGGLFIWLGLNLMGVSACKLPTGHIGNLKIRGHLGALLLGLSYGILSGACTFGFIAPILAIITVQAEFAKGISLVITFALGHCLPIALAGSSVALAQRMLAAKGMQTATVWGRKLAGGVVALVGVYFLYTGSFGVARNAETNVECPVERSVGRSVGGTQMPPKVVPTAPAIDAVRSLGWPLWGCLGA